MTSAFQRLVDYDPEENAPLLSKWVEKARDEGVTWSMQEQLQSGFECFFMGVMVGAPQPMDAVRDALDFFVNHGATPFRRHLNSSSVYHALVMGSPPEGSLEWCRALPCAPASAETNPDRRLRSDILEAILLENPVPGSIRQSSALDLFHFPLLETWADGQTTLDRLLHRYFQWSQLEKCEPIKDFELAEVQRGFSRVALRLIKEAPGSAHVHAIRWHAQHHAQHCQHKLDNRFSSRQWGDSEWQAAVRHLDQVLCKACNLPAKTPERRSLALREEGLAYLASRELPHYWSAVVVAAAAYDMKDHQEHRKLNAQAERDGRPPGFSYSLTDDQHWQARAGTCVARLLAGCEIDEADVLVDSSDAWLDFSRAMLVMLADNQEFALSPAIVPVALPLFARNVEWSADEDRFEAAVSAGAPWPSGSPFEQWSARAKWSDKIQAALDAHSLQQNTPLPKVSRPARRM